MAAQAKTKHINVSQEEVDKFLLSEDYEKTKEFFEFVKTGGETINLTDLS